MLPGRLTRWKGQAVLIEAVARLGRDDVRCLIVGSDQGRTGYRRELEGLIAKRRLEGIVHLVGDCTDMPAALMLADVVVSASTDPEAFGRVMVEAQAMGCPIVAADHGASQELVLPNETGWLVPPNDPDALADTLRSALATRCGVARGVGAACDLADAAAFHQTDDVRGDLGCVSGTARRSAARR